MWSLVVVISHMLLLKKKTTVLTICGVQHTTKTIHTIAINFANATSSGVWYLAQPTRLLIIDLLTLLTNILFCDFILHSSQMTQVLHITIQIHKVAPEMKFSTSILWDLSPNEIRELWLSLMLITSCWLKPEYGSDHPKGSQMHPGCG